MEKNKKIQSEVDSGDTFEFVKTQSAIEDIKEKSQFLRGTVAQQLANENVEFFSEVDKQIIKFYGLYQQKDRDRFDAEGNRVNKPFTFMLRGRIPGGRLNWKQYCLWDDLADKYSNFSLRLTTRQSIQLHYLRKYSLKEVIQSIEKIGLTTMGACGDVVRNVTQAINPKGEHDLALLDEVSELLSEHFKYKTKAYVEIWLNEEQLNKDDEEVLYGNKYLPRKFKLGVTLVGNNSIDLYTNDMAFAATVENGKISGYFVFAGGGLGMVHRNPNTFPRAASLLGWVSQEWLIPVAEAIVGIHRDYGNRLDRKTARLKYIIPKKGLDWFKKEVEVRSGVNLENKQLPKWETFNPVGWFERVDGTLALGLHTLAGRIKDTKEVKFKSALRKIIEHFKLDVQLSVDQNPILLGIKKGDKGEVESMLAEHSVNPFTTHSIYNFALACPALPTCGLAITESERFFPDLLKSIKEKVEKHNLLEEKVPTIRMTGCPNGCAKPYSAEIGIVGQQVGGKYALFLGGNREGTKVGTMVAERVPVKEIPEKLENLIIDWKKQCPNIYFGDYVERKGTDYIKDLINK